MNFWLAKRGHTGYSSVSWWVRRQAGRQTYSGEGVPTREHDSREEDRCTQR